MAEIINFSEGFEQNDLGGTELRPAAGLSDWKRAVEVVGNRSLAGFIETMDPGKPTGKINAHQAIVERLEALGMPTESHISATVANFTRDPGRYVEQLANGDYFFVSIRPGVHLAHAEKESDVVSFVQEFSKDNPDSDSQNQEIYLSRNGEPILSGHLIVRDDGEPNSVYGEFTNRDFKSFHLGRRTPEILVRRDRYRFNWTFCSHLEADDDNWRSDEKFICNGGVELTRPEMAQKIFSAIRRLPQDGGRYLPGYYEVLLEQTSGTNTRAAFIEAIVSKALSAHLDQ